jgi:hypothetical protein
VRFHTACLSPGDYQGRLRILSNDPDEPSADIPVTLQVASPTGVETARPGVFVVKLAGGNPARGTVRLRVAPPERGAVDLRVFNVRGALVRALPQRVVDAGFHVLEWDGRDERGGRTASGLYFVRLRAGEDFEPTLRVVSGTRVGSRAGDQRCATVVRQARSALSKSGWASMPSMNLKPTMS